MTEKEFEQRANELRPERPPIDDIKGNAAHVQWCTREREWEELERERIRDLLWS